MPPIPLSVIKIDDTDAKVIARKLREGPSEEMRNYVASIFEVAAKEGECDMSRHGDLVQERMREGVTT